MINRANNFLHYRFFFFILVLYLSTSLLSAKANSVPMCWAIDDETPTIYQFSLDTSNPQPPSTITTPKVNGGEGLAWRPSTNELFMWDGDTTYVVDITTGAEVRSFTADLSPGTHVEGADFYVDPVTKIEELWLIVQNYTGSNRDDRYLIRIDPDSGANILSVGPLFGGYIDGSVDYGKDTGGLAIDPNTKQFWVTNDGLNRGVYPLNETTGEVGTGAVFNPQEVDAEVLAFADDGKLYTESDEGPSNDRYIWQIDGATGNITRAAGAFPGSGDIEGMACNSGARVFSTPATLQINKTADISAASHGDLVVYTVTVTNSSSENATGVVVTDVISPRVTYVSDDGGSATSKTGNVVMWNIASLAAGADAVLKITVRVN